MGRWSIRRFFPINLTDWFSNPGRSSPGTLLLMAVSDRAISFDDEEFLVPFAEIEDWVDQASEELHYYDDRQKLLYMRETLAECPWRCTIGSASNWQDPKTIRGGDVAIEECDRGFQVHVVERWTHPRRDADATV